MVNLRHPLRKIPLWKALPYLAPLESVLPQRIVDWANGRQEKLTAEIEGEEPKAKVEKRRKTYDTNKLSSMVKGLDLENVTAEKPKYLQETVV